MLKVEYLVINDNETYIEDRGHQKYQVTFTISGGTAPYSYRWSNNATTPSVSNLSAGNYTVTTTDASGCTATASFTIQGQGNINMAVSSSPTSCGSSTGMATVSSVSGGTAPYTYRWHNGATTQTISNVGIGIYYVTVTDAAGCTASRSVEVQATNGLQITVSNTKADCNAANGTAPSAAIWAKLTCRPSMTIPTRKQLREAKSRPRWVRSPADRSPARLTTSSRRSDGARSQRCLAVV